MKPYALNSDKSFGLQRGLMIPEKGVFFLNIKSSVNAYKFMGVEFHEVQGHVR